MKKQYYVAYGSNLNKEQMKRRCPGAGLVGIGQIRDYELQFRGYPQGAFATIIPKKGASVPVGVWKIDRANERSLDLYEGVPNHYFKQSIPVVLQNGQKILAMVYVMNQQAKIGLPTAHYYKTVQQGYLDCGLDLSFLNTALLTSFDHFYGTRFETGENMPIPWVAESATEYDEESGETTDAFEDSRIVDDEDEEVDPWQMQW